MTERIIKPCDKCFAHSFRFLFVIIFLILNSATSVAKNPFLPPTAFIPDGEPHVFNYEGKPRLFVYGSRDERITGFCGFGHDLWSAPVEDLSQWTNHGEIFHVKQVADIGYGKVEQQHFGAPDAAYNPITKKYYLYTFLGARYLMDGTQGPLPGADNYVPGFQNYGPKCVMAVSDSPVGPFKNPVMCDWPPANDAGTFDPSVLVDEQADGSIKVYTFWGMRQGDRWAQLDPVDMHTIINPKTGKPDRNAWQKTLDPEIIKHSTLFEASSIKKITDNHYVFIYSSNEEKSALTYAYSNKPTGPWHYGGEIVRNDRNWVVGNNHGSIAKVGDQWYVVYHKPTNDHKNRQAMIEPIDVILEKGKVIIPTVEMTSQGIHKNGLDAFKRYNAHIASYRSNSAYINAIPRNVDGLNPIAGISGPENTVGFKYMNFGASALKNSDQLSLKLNVKLINKTKVTVAIATPGPGTKPEQRIVIAESSLDHSMLNTFGEAIIPINKLSENTQLEAIGGLKGKFAVFLTFSGEVGELCQLKELEFVKKVQTNR